MSNTKIMSKLRHLIAGCGVAILLATPMLMPAVVHAAPAPTTPSAAESAARNGLNCGGELTASSLGDPKQACDAPQAKAGKSVDGIITLVVNVLSLLVGVAAVIMIIIGGLKYITSQGESSNTASAKNTILYAVIGLVIVALAQIIVRFTLHKTQTATGSLPKCTASTSPPNCTP